MYNNGLSEILSFYLLGLAAILFGCEQIMLKTVNLHSSVLCKFVQLWSVFIQGVEVPLLQLQHFIILVVYDFFSRIVSYVLLLSVLISFRVELWWRTF